MLTDEELTAMRAVQGQTMTETVYVQRLTRTADSTGGWSESWTTAATVSGRIAPRMANSGENKIGGKVETFGDYLITLPHDTNVQTDDRLQINGEQYQIQSILERSKKTALRLICVKLG